MDKTVWYAIDISTSADAVEAAEFALNELDALGTEVIDFTKQASVSVTVTGYFDSVPDSHKVLAALNYAFQVHNQTDVQDPKITTRLIENADWLAEWKRHWQPTRIGRFVIAAPWHMIDDIDKIAIRIEPNMAFGTGTHETTQLCLKEIERYFKTGYSFLDVGTGTGILAIAAAKLQSEGKRESTSVKGVDSECTASIGGVDNDPNSITIARENAEANGVAELIDFHVATLSSKTPYFDLICANLTLDVISPLLPLLLEKAERSLVLSGILVGQEKEIFEKLGENGFQNPAVSRAGEWIAVTIHKH